ncbi:TetR/AcrR family transcriptional regulator [Flavobacterium sp. SE-1-e]|uniref:TetR/AcrR family transcriptional regulator n=2 Tax=Flavobacterium agrisoli TaxID=2793066 RepID=A0A934PN07_9FLAO|nr:TetR/AcrR family transcriptional regulator [Flavobacterium agrisoli]MBK0369860.1 TetR/AcrR family transcriptional regulator [Flavobacterium agrisoli]
MLTNELNEKKIHILKVAEKLFAEKGFEGTSIRSISKEAKINIAMISYYFGSKESLLESLILYKISDLKQELENLSKENLQPVDKVNKLIELYINRINCNRGVFRIMHFEMTSKKSSDRKKVFTEIKMNNLEIIERIIREGQEKGVFRKDIVIPLLTPTILGTYFNFFINKEFYEELLDLKTEKKFNAYINNNLTKHIQQTIKALLVYEN